MFNHFNFLIKAAIVVVLSLFFVVFSSLWYFSSGLPDYKKLESYEPPVSSRIYSNNGSLIAEYAIEKRLFIPYDSIPTLIVNAFLSAEDKNFFNHPGIDPKGIIRAVLNNFKNIAKDKRLEGKILELYLNQIYLGEGTYGIAAASLEYFDKSVKELNYSEAALLAALPKAPSKYNPFKHYDLAKLRRDLVLQNLNENNFINNKDFEKYKKEKINLKKRKIKLLKEANYYSEEIRRTIKNNYGFDKLYAEGLSIKSALDVDYQLHALSALRSGIESYDRRHGWRGPVLNTKLEKDWLEKLKEKKIDSSLGWKFAKIVEVN